MQINRLFETLYILLAKKTITAKELAAHFEVSMRTIYRDVEILSMAGIPIYTNKGKGGGISLLEDFVLNKSMFSEFEQHEILMSLQSLHAVQVPDVKSVLNKLRGIFNKEINDWVDVDFSPWGSNGDEREIFNLLKTAILHEKVLNFNYFSSTGGKNARVVEPLKLIFKGRGWYLYAYCRGKKAFRIFKVTRMKNIISSQEIFERKKSELIWHKPSPDYADRLVTLILKIDARLEYRIYDEVDQDKIIKNSDGTFTMTMIFPEDEWLYGYILSYGNYAEVIEPKHIREIIKNKLQAGLEKYL